MASIPLFEGRAGSLPNITPEDFRSVPELLIRARESGQNLAQSQEQVRASEQQRELAPLELQLRQEQVQTQRQNSAIAQQQLNLEQDKYAQEVKLQKRKQEFYDIFQSADPQAKKNAVTSGQFADVLGSDPKLAEYAVRTTQDLMTEKEREGFQEYLGNNFLYKYMFTHQQKFEDGYTKAIGDLIADDKMQNMYQTYFPGKDFRSIPDMIETIPSDTYEKDDAGEPVVDNGRLKRKNGVDTENPLGGWDAFVRGTGQRVGQGFNKEQIKNIEAARAGKFLTGKTGIPNSIMSPADIGVEKNRQEKQVPEQAPEQGSTGRRELPGTTANMGGFSLFGGDTGKIEVDGVLYDKPEAPAQGRTIADWFGPQNGSNTPDTNQAPVQNSKAAILNSIQSSPAAKGYYEQKKQAYRQEANDAVSGRKEDISFAPAVAQTAQMFREVDYRPQDIEPTIIAQINTEPLLVGKDPLIKGLAAAESSGSRGAKSPTGVRGLLQVTRDTAREMGFNRDIPRENVAAGEKYLYQQLRRFSKPELALAAYNVGPGFIAEAMRQTGSADWSVIRDYLEDVLDKKMFNGVKDFPARVLNYAAAFAGTEV